MALSDAGGTLTDRYAYAPFGKLAGSQGTTANPFRYVGKYGLMDEGNGLLFVRARYYEPDSGRFLSKDPLPGMDGDTQAMHRFVYAGNNPVRFVDLSGLSPLEGGHLTKQQKRALMLLRQKYLALYERQWVGPPASSENEAGLLLKGCQNVKRLSAVR